MRPLLIALCIQALSVCAAPAALVQDAAGTRAAGRARPLRVHDEPVAERGGSLEGPIVATVAEAMT